MRKLLFILTPLCLLLSTMSCADARDSKSASNSDSRVAVANTGVIGNWVLTEAFLTDGNDVKDESESQVVQEQLTKSNQFKYQVTDKRLTVLVNDQPTFLYYYEKDSNGRITIDEPEDQAFQLVRGLQLIEVDSHIMTLKCNGSDHGTFLYTTFEKL